MRTTESRCTICGHDMSWTDQITCLGCGHCSWCGTVDCNHVYNDLGREKDKLALGSGNRFRGCDYIHLDLTDAENVDVVHDLEKGTLPFDKNSFNHVEAVHVLEHLRKVSLIEILKHVRMVLKDGGTFRVVMPHFLSWNSSDIDHHRSGSRNSFVQFCSGYPMNSPYPDLFVEKEINFKLRNRYKLFGRLIGNDKVAELFPNTVQEIEYIFEVEK